MTLSLQAIFENGVLRPLEPLALRERQEVTVTITDEVDLPGLPGGIAADFSGEPVTLERVRAGLAKIPGSLSEEFVKEREDRY
jgi:predicted DNA-binding antitoxin AbrB/MazE fold protein